MNTPAEVAPHRSFWPVGEAAQANYETLRTHVMTAGVLPDTLIAARFARRGLAGLVAWPSSEPIFHAELVGANRPAWTPQADPRLDVLTERFLLLLRAAEPADPEAVTGTGQWRWSK